MKVPQNDKGTKKKKIENPTNANFDFSAQFQRPRDIYGSHEKSRIGSHWFQAVDYASW